MRIHQFRTISSYISGRKRYREEPIREMSLSTYADIIGHYLCDCANQLAKHIICTLFVGMNLVV